jgi:hypothetical protein
MQRRTIDADHLDAAAGGEIGPGDPPNGIAMVPAPSMIGFSNVKSRPTWLSARRLRNG